MAIFAIAGCTSNPKPSGSSTHFQAEIGEVMKWFDHGVAGETNFYNYCPSTFIENNERYVYYCTNYEEGNVTDYIGYRHAVYNEKEGWKWDDIKYVLGPTEPTEEVPIPWDKRHTCDPSVVKGEFKYQGTTYSYLMGFLGSVRSDNNGNETGFAVSNDPAGPWIKCETINPLLKYDEETMAWGLGQVSLVNLDNKGDILMFYSSGNKDGTYEQVAEYDFSNLDEPQLIRNARVPTNGLLSGDNIITDADICYDAENERLIMVKGKMPYSPDGQSPNFIASTLIVYYMTLSGNENPADELFKGVGARNWRLVGEIGESLTGFKRNHNAGLVTDPYGHLLPNASSIEVALTRSDLANGIWGYLSTYRIYSTSLELPYLD